MQRLNCVTIIAEKQGLNKDTVILEEKACVGCDDEEFNGVFEFGTGKE